MEINKVVENLDQPRKKSRRVNEWKSTKAKLARYKSKGLPKMPTCAHKKNNSYRCNVLLGHDCYLFNKQFYLCNTKPLQDAFILGHTKISVPVRTDRRAGGPQKKFATKYFVRNRKGKLIRVCLPAFKNILRIGLQRINGICKRFFECGTIPKENRGGNRKAAIYEPKKDAVKNFIKSFYVQEIHYCRSKTSARQYLSGDLSIQRMWKMFNTTHVDTPVSKWFFQNVFRTNFNVSFKTPSTDQCSKCLMYNEKIKISENAGDKMNLMTAKRIHSLRAKAFYSLAKEQCDNMITFSFDCQKNMPLPKVPDQAAYFSRQLNLYNLAIVQRSSKAAISKENVFLYLWTEEQRPKGCNEISSAVFNRLKSTSFSLDTHIIRLICDGCGAQNKNSAMVAMCSYWLNNSALPSIKQVQIIYPVPGHSYIPPDRIFALLEKRTKSINTIIGPDDYKKIYSEYGSIITIGSQECPVYDWKTQSASCYKTTGNWHFEFNKSKRFIINRSSRGVCIRGEIAYRSDLCAARSVLKRGCTVPENFPDQLTMGRIINSAKLKDINSLLTKHFGDNWTSLEKLSFYKNLLLNSSNTSSSNPNECDYDECDTFFEDKDLRV